MQLCLQVCIICIQKFVHAFVWLCMCVNWAGAACHLSAQHELWVNCGLTDGVRMPLPIHRSKADVSLALKLQSHSWQLHSVRDPTSYLAERWCSTDELSVFQKTAAKPYPRFLLSKHAQYTSHSALPCPDLVYSLSPMAILSSFNSFSHSVSLSPSLSETHTHTTKEHAETWLVEHSVSVWV